MDSPFVRPENGVLYAFSTTPDQWVADFVAEIVSPEDRIDTHNRAIITGYRAIAAAKTNGGLMALSEQLYSSVQAAGMHATAVVKEVGDKLEAVSKSYLAPGGTFAKVLDEFANAVGGKLDPNSEPMQKLRDGLRREYALTMKTGIDEIRGLMNLADEKSPVARIHRDVQELAVKVAEVKTQLDANALVHQARQASPIVAGRSLEQFANEVIAPISSLHGETFDDVRDVVSTTAERSKKGDFVATLDGRLTRGVTARLVVEAKNRKSVTVSALLKELDAAMESRQAIGAVGILTNASAKCRPIAGYEGNKVVVALPGFGTANADYAYFASLIELGYEYGRLLVAARATMTPTDAIDLQAILRQTDDVSKQASRLRELMDNLTRIGTAVDAAKGTATEVRDGIIAAVGALRQTLKAEFERLNSRKNLPPAA